LARNLNLTQAVTIAASATTSTTATMDGGRIPLAILTPATLEGTEFKFQASRDGDNFFALYNGSTEYAVTVAASRYVALNPDVFESVKYVKIVSNAAGGEDALRTIYVISGER